MRTFRKWSKCNLSWKAGECCGSVMIAPPLRSRPPERQEDWCLCKAIVARKNAPERMAICSSIKFRISIASRPTARKNKFNQLNSVARNVKHPIDLDVQISDERVQVISIQRQIGRWLELKLMSEAEESWSSKLHQQINKNMTLAPKSTCFALKLRLFSSKIFQFGNSCHTTQTVNFLALIQIKTTTKTDLLAGQKPCWSTNFRQLSREMESITHIS